MVSSFFRISFIHIPVVARREEKFLYSIVTTAILHGIDSQPVLVEADVSDGLPIFEMVGFLASEVREARERVRTALRNCGHQLPAKRFRHGRFRKSRQQ